ncbi:hypothetical protein EVAR_12119_1 [Eumeta japonica]|uniref:Uncharacterized protein n=1 Tax=Eumeta variegata TaxID=151549 RepID=A0A4C1U5H6_EUMVA|nr:hypothetical protein EVAR_12119_1 [Eumeta japonica]
MLRRPRRRKRKRVISAIVQQLDLNARHGSGSTYFLCFRDDCVFVMTGLEKDNAFAQIFKMYNRWLSPANLANKLFYRGRLDASLSINSKLSLRNKRTIDQICE